MEQKLSPYGYPMDEHTSRNGHTFRIHFFKHSALAIEFEGKWIYTDPVCGFADYDRLPKADLILVGHHHYDHFEVEALKRLWQPTTQLIADHTTAQMAREAGYTAQALRPEEQSDPFAWLHIESLRAYNYSEGHTDFHPREREDLGYILTLDGTRIYIAGDGENTPEMKGVQAIDIAFLPVNQPYTMTVDQALDALQAIRPTLFYPYHYGQVEEQTDLERLEREASACCEVRLRGME